MPQTSRLALALSLALPVLLAREARSSSGVAPCDATCDSLSCTFGGILNQPLGGATLSIDHSRCELLIDHIDGTGSDGVEQSGLSLSECTVANLATPNLSAASTGTQMWISDVGVVDGTTGQVILTSIIGYSATGLELQVQCPGALGGTYVTEIYNAAGLVYATAPGSNPELTFPRVDVTAFEWDVRSDGGFDTSMSFGAPTAFSFIYPAAPGGPYTGTCLRVRAFRPGTAPIQQSMIQETFRNTGSIRLASLSAGPLPANDVVCGQPLTLTHSMSWGAVKALYR